MLMILHTGKDNSLHYEMEKLAITFFPYRKIKVMLETEPDVLKEREAATSVIELFYKEGDETIKAAYTDNMVQAAESEPVIEGENPELAAGRALYRVLSGVTGQMPKWGILTGVRPAKVMMNRLEISNKEDAINYFKEKLYVSSEKAMLAAEVAESEKIIIDTSVENGYSLYVSIPFCPNRCVYCSFVSQAIGSPAAKKLLPEYFEKLLIDLEETARIAERSGLHLQSIYIGGGTPSTLSEEQIKRLLLKIKTSFDLSNCSEFTFEAGRPDTLTAAKLKAINEGGPDRISINPQTMTDSILEAMGRTHSADDVVKVFEEAREIGIKNINMDLIAGLPGDTPENFERSLKDVLSLSPESITVHTLAHKRSSSLMPTEELFSQGDKTAEMVDTADKLLYNNGYVPYYMYRQARSVGNLENVGWCKPGYESKYNVYMMEECHSVFACGAGAVTKLVKPGSKKINRIFGYKYPKEYIERFNILLKKKQAILNWMDVKA